MDLDENVVKLSDRRHQNEENKNMNAQVISDDECEAEAVENKYNQNKFFYDH